MSNFRFCSSYKISTRYRSIWQVSTAIVILTATDNATCVQPTKNVQPKCKLAV